MEIQNRSLRGLLGIGLACSLLCGMAFSQTIPATNPAVQPTTKPATKPAAENKKIAVAIYKDKGAYGKGPEMLVKTFAAEADFLLVPVSAEEIVAGKLKEFRALIVPGGSSATIGKTLGQSGLEAIRAYVNEGGTYVGICAGCYLSTHRSASSLKILPAKIVDPKNSYRGKATLQLDLTDEGKKWLSRQDLQPKAVYHNGPVLEPIADAGQKLIPLATYREEITRQGAKPDLMINTPAIAAAAYGKGWAVGISPHPEQTEGLKDVVPLLLRWTLTRAEK